MVNLADGRVLARQLAFLATKFRDVAQQQDGTDSFTALGQRDSADRNDGGPGEEVGLARHASAHHHRQHLVGGEFLGVPDTSSNLGEDHPFHGGGIPHSVERRQGVGARVGDGSVSVKLDQPVRCARCTEFRTVTLRRVREASFGNHRIDLLSGFDERLGLSIRAVVGHEGVAGQHRDWLRTATAANRNRTNQRRRLFEPDWLGRFDHRSTTLALVDQLVPGAADTRAHNVPIEHRARRARPKERDGHPRFIFRSHPHRDVGEREVRHNLTFANEVLQPLDVIRGHVGMLGDNFGEGQHALQATAAIATCEELVMPRPHVERPRATASGCSEPDLTLRRPLSDRRPE